MRWDEYFRKRSFIVVVQKRAVAFHAVRTHDGIIDFKLIDKIDRRHARNPAVQGANDAGSNDDGVVGARGRDGGNVNIVGDNPQVFTLLDQLGGNGFHRRAYADKQRRIVGNVGGNQAGDGVFFILAVFSLTLRHAARNIADRRSAVVTLQLPRFAQFLYVAAYGLRGNVQGFRKLLDRHEMLLAHPGKDVFVSLYFRFHLDLFQFVPVRLNSDCTPFAQNRKRLPPIRLYPKPKVV